MFVIFLISLIYLLRRPTDNINNFVKVKSSFGLGFKNLNINDKAKEKNKKK